MSPRFHMALPANTIDVPSVVQTDPVIAATLPTGYYTTKGKIEFGRHIRDGGHGSAYYALINGNEVVIKTFRVEAVFFQELKAYNLMQSVPELKGRIPAFLGVISGTVKALASCGYNTAVGDRAIVIEYCPGETVEKLESTLTKQQLADMRVTIDETITLLHKSGIAHGDPFANNVIVTDSGARLIDFSHPKFREAISSDEQWERVTEHDFKIVNYVFTTGNDSAQHLYIIPDAPTTPIPSEQRRLLTRTVSDPFGVLPEGEHL